MSDRQAVLDLFFRSSPQTRYARFHHAVAAMPRHYLDEILNRKQFALAARESRGAVESSRIVGLASAAHLTDEVAEVAVWVDDSWQRLGVGTVLTHRLLQALADAEYRTAIGFIEPENLAVRKLIEKVAPGHSIRFTDGLVAVYIPLHPFLCNDG
jgi:acetyltransferase